MEKSLDSLHWLHGLEEYFEFTGDETSRNYILFVLKLLYANEPIIKSNDHGDMVEFVGTLRKFAPNSLLDTFHKFFRHGGDVAVLSDAYSRGQVQSKIWLVNELAKVSDSFDNIVILAGWYGQLVRMLNQKIKFEKVRVLDIDRDACVISDKIFNAEYLDSYKVKSVHADISKFELIQQGLLLDIEKFETGKIYKELFLPDLIINTSAEHLDDGWYNRIRFKNLDSKPIVAIQSNNLFDVPEHVNCVHSIDHMQKKFPMTELLYSGEIQLKGYKRFMLIGRP